MRISDWSSDVCSSDLDPTTLNRQGNDVGTQYRSAIFPHSPEQEKQAEAAIARAQGNWPGPIVTTIEPLSNWYAAEDYHQLYWERMGTRNGYCMATIPPKLRSEERRVGKRCVSKVRTRWVPESKK